MVCLSKVSAGSGPLFEVSVARVALGAAAPVFVDRALAATATSKNLALLLVEKGDACHGKKDSWV
jgi:hypothetical protein